VPPHGGSICFDGTFQPASQKEEKMPVRHLARVALALAFVSFFVSRTSAATITLVGGVNDVLHVSVQNFRITADKTEHPDPVPSNKTVSVALDGDSSSLTANLSNSAFVISFAQVADISKTLGEAHLAFTVSDDVRFSLAGSFSVDNAAFGQQLSATLSEKGPGDAPTKILYTSTQIGSYNSPTTLTLGGHAGTTTNDLFVGASDTLHPGFTYLFDALAGFEAPTDPNGAGNITLAFAPVGGGTNPVPLPPAALAGLAWAAGLAGWRKCRRHG
jgi:hypothetical protein